MDHSPPESLSQRLDLDDHVVTTAVAVVRWLQSRRFDLSTEKNLQSDVETELRKSGWTFEREKRLSTRDIPDFLIEQHVVVECKMRKKARPLDVYKQLERYASHDEVHALVLATNLSMGLPSEILGKPVYLASLSRGWL